MSADWSLFYILDLPSHLAPLSGWSPCHYRAPGNTDNTVNALLFYKFSYLLITNSPDIFSSLKLHIFSISREQFLRNISIMSDEEINIGSENMKCCDTNSAAVEYFLHHRCNLAAITHSVVISQHGTFSLHKSELLISRNCHSLVMRFPKSCQP